MQNIDDDGVRLVACDRDGKPLEPIDNLPSAIAEGCAEIANLIDRADPPWAGYVAMAGNDAVGIGAFVAPPADNRVEIAYFTLPELRGRGLAARTARELVAIARSHVAGIEVFAKTRPEPNPSSRILERLGFRMIGMTTDHEIGDAWAWLLQ